MITLPQYPMCRGCGLAEGTPPTRIGMAARIADHTPPGKKKAVYFLAKAPAYDEMATGLPLSGPAGVHANNTYIRGTGLHELADCYLGNVVRCRLANAKMAVPEPALRACRGHWEEDLRLMDAAYDEVVVVCLGAESVKAVLGCDTSLATFRQGGSLSLAGKPRTIFATYMPTVLLPGNDPAKITAIVDHLLLLKEYLVEGKVLTKVTVTREEIDYSSRVPEGCPLISLDIETYGKISTLPNQRFFHPKKMYAWDGITPEQLCQTAGIAWRTPEGDLKHRLYVLTSLKDKEEFVEDMLKMWRPDAVILGQNIQFDIICLREYDPRLREMLEPFEPRTPKLRELMVLNFLDSDQRPERSLKSVARLLSILEYDELDLDKKDYRRHASPEDPDLHVYQIQDVYATIIAAEMMQRGFTTKFGPKTNKGSPYCLDWFSDLAWLAISMSLEGIKYDVKKLEEACDLHEYLLLRWEDWFIDTHGEVLRRSGAGPRAERILKGIDISFLLEKNPCKTEKGTAKRKEKMATLLEGAPPWMKLTKPQETVYARFIDLLQKYDLGGDKRLKKTDGGDISVDAGNRKLLLGYATGGDRAWLKAYGKFQGYTKTLGTYLAPALGRAGNDKDTLNDKLVEGFTYPSWRIVPTMDEGGELGGTQQGRITPRGRAVQTDPPVVEDAEISRYPGGAIVRFDGRQIELRVPVGYSHEAEIAEDFRQGKSPYERAASLVLGRPVTKATDKPGYALGKMVMLAIQFRAQAKKLQEASRADLGVDKPIPFWQDVIRTMFADRAGLIRVQDEWIARAKKEGFLEVPLLGISRTFLGAVDETYIPTVVNFPVQTLAAVIVLDAQIAAEKWLRANGLRTRLIKNTYDEGSYDCPPEEVDVVVKKLPEFYRNPPIYQKLVEQGFFPVPLDCSVEIRYNCPPTTPTGDSDAPTETPA